MLLRTCQKNAEPAAGGLSQSGFGAFSHAVQFEIECGVQLLLGSCPQLGNLMLEFLYATSQAYYLEGESLFRCAAYITQQGACHVATFHTTASMPMCFPVGHRPTLSMNDPAEGARSPHKSQNWTRSTAELPSSQFMVALR